MNATLQSRPDTAAQQPDWSDSPELPAVRQELAARPALVNAADLHLLRGLLARVAAGEAYVVQAGDCAEDPAECGQPHIARKTGLIDTLAGLLTMRTHRPVVRVGRIAGQFAKPRSSATEVVGGVEMPAYRGHFVNRPGPQPQLRRPDPRNLLAGYDAARTAMGHLGWLEPLRHLDPGPVIWTSHEALLMDYEMPLQRRDAHGSTFLGSTHWPWIGDRTRQLDGAHVALLAGVVNPVACKVGPSLPAEDLLRLCERLDPWREPGRLTLIARMGAAETARRLPALVNRVRAAGHPVVWLTDPMHGNTVRTAQGHKTRHVGTVIDEVRAFQEAVREAGGVAGGLHLESTPDDVTECVGDDCPASRVGERYTSLCDPRLNPEQAMAVVAAWQR